MRAARADEAKGIVPGGGESTRSSTTTTASIKLVKRAALPPQPTWHLRSSNSPPTNSAFSPDGVDIQTAPATDIPPPPPSSTDRFVVTRVHRAIVDRRGASSRHHHHHGAAILHFDDGGGAGLSSWPELEERQGNAGLAKRDPPASESSTTTTTTRRPSSSSTSTRSTPPTTTPTTTSSPKPGPTATNAALVKDDDETQASSSSSCAYIGETSIPKGAGGALFSTLERIFACKSKLCSIRVCHTTHRPFSPPSLYPGGVRLPSSSPVRPRH